MVDFRYLVNMKIFALRLKEARMYAGLTQKEMAKELEIPLDTYRNYESIGSRNCEPDIEMLVKIADVLKVSLDYLTGRE